MDLDDDAKAKNERLIRNFKGKRRGIVYLECNGKLAALIVGEPGAMYFTLGNMFDLWPETIKVNGRRIPPKPNNMYPQASWFPLLTPEEWRNLDYHDPMYPLHITGEPKGFSWSQLTEFFAELGHMTTEAVTELCNTANPPGTAKQGREDPSMGSDNDVQAKNERFRQNFKGKQRGKVYLECKGKLAAMSASQRGSMYFTLGTIFDLRPETIHVNGRRIRPEPNGMYPEAGYFPLLTPEEWRNLDYHDPMHPLHITGKPKGFSWSQLTEVATELCHMAHLPGAAKQVSKMASRTAVTVDCTAQQFLKSGLGRSLAASLGTGAPVKEC